MIADELISVRHRVVAGGDRGHVCVLGCVTRSTWEMLGSPGQRAGLQHWAGDWWTEVPFSQPG